jgi:N-acylneuraminate cytidylyltransferase/CMP-N,N'-diacetyllegionaminic acid synthase
MSALGNQVLAIIPARGGSKGIPRKNVVNFRGRPLIDYTVDAAQTSRSIDRILVSSEDQEILNHVLARGLETSYVRPNELAMDDTPVIDVVIHGLDWLQQETQYVPDIVLLLQPTSPLRTEQDIDEFLDWFARSSMRSAVSVHRVVEHPMECVTVQPDGSWAWVWEPPQRTVGRQTYPPAPLFINGAMYAADPSFLRHHRRFILRDEAVGFFEMPAERGLDIDTPSDLLR